MPLRWDTVEDGKLVQNDGDRADISGPSETVEPVSRARGGTVGCISGGAPANATHSRGECPVGDPPPAGKFQVYRVYLPCVAGPLE